MVLTLANVRLVFKVMAGSCYQLVKPPPDVSISTNEMNHHVTQMHNALIILVHTLVSVPSVILVMATLVLISTNVTRSYQRET